MQAVLPRPDVAPLLQEHFVAVAADPDEPDPEAHALLFELPNATMLPIVVLADARGAFIDGGAGAFDPERLKAMLQAAVAAR